MQTSGIFYTESRFFLKKTYSRALPADSKGHGIFVNTKTFTLRVNAFALSSSIGTQGGHGDYYTY